MWARSWCVGSHRDSHVRSSRRRPAAPHVGPVDVAGLDIYRDTIGDAASGDEVGLAGAVGVDGEQTSVAAGFEHEQPRAWIQS